MATDPIDPIGGRDRLNPSVEATKIDDAHAKRLREDATGLGAAAGAGAGCLGMTLLPWLMIALGLTAAVVVGVVRGWFK